MIPCPLSRFPHSQAEVATVSHLPLSAFTSPARIRPYMFRAASPYWAIDVSDFVEGFEGVNNPLGHPEVGDGKEGRLEVLGLTVMYVEVRETILEKLSTQARSEALFDDLPQAELPFLRPTYGARPIALLTCKQRDTYVVLYNHHLCTSPRLEILHVVE
ncbi:hypothetical protein F4604DRAFT_887123 [Suillus subluteus]|nr:hypothetical protein F4604DRAFT_887123 [Suillus subluteus]